MADQQHLDRLRQGVSSWNAWRAEQRPRFQPDLREAHLIQANLSGADLRGALQPHFLITAIEGKLFSLSSTCFEHIVEVSHILIGKIHTGPNHEFPPHGMSKSCVASAKNGGLSLGENLHFLLLRQWKP